MIKKFFPVLIFFYLLMGISAAYAYSDVITDTSSVSIRKPPADKISRYAHSDTFQYGTVKGSESFWQKIQIWLWEQFLKLLNQKATKNILEVAFFLLVIFIIVMIIKQFADGGLFRTQASPPADFNIEKITHSPTDLQPQIQKAIDNKNYNRAIRLLYKRSLVQLQNHGRISWQKNKTNHQYIYEITQQNLQQIFRQLTYYYEYAEYGNFSISDINFQQAHKQFKRMESILGSS